MLGVLGGCGSLKQALLQSGFSASVCRIEEAKSCEQVLPSLRAEPKARSFEFAKAMQVCGDLRDLPTLLRVWNLSRERNIPLKLTAYSILIQACAKAIDRQRRHTKKLGLVAGKRAWQWMLHDGHKPDAAVVKAALHLCSKAGDAEWATQLWQNTPECSTALWNRYLDTLARHSGPEGWEAVEEELRNSATRRLVPDCVTLATLMDAAAEQNDMQRADNFWDHLSPSVELTSITYAARSKSFLLGSKPECVPDLRCDMQRRSISPNIRNILHEVQAWLLLLHQEPQDRSRYERLSEASARATSGDT